MKNINQYKLLTTAKAGLLSLFLLTFLSSFAVDTPAKNPVVIKDIVIDESFTSVEVRGNVIIVLTNGPLDTLSIKGKEKDVKWISAEVKNGKLVVKSPRYSFNKIVVYIPAMSLRSMVVNGDAAVQGGVIDNKELKIKLNGTITVDIMTRGKVKVEAEEGYELENKS